jgi:hypothetical protein
VLATFLLGPPRFRRQAPKPSRAKPPTPRPIPSADNRTKPLQPNCAQGSSV